MWADFVREREKGDKLCSHNRRRSFKSSLGVRDDEAKCRDAATFIICVPVASHDLLRWGQLHLEPRSRYRTLEGQAGIIIEDDGVDGVFSPCFDIDNLLSHESRAVYLPLRFFTNQW